MTYINLLLTVAEFSEIIAPTITASVAPTAVATTAASPSTAATADAAADAAATQFFPPAEAVAEQQQ